MNLNLVALFESSNKTTKLIWVFFWRKERKVCFCEIHFHVNGTLKYGCCPLFIYLFYFQLLVSVSLRMHRTNRCHINEKGKTPPLENTPKEAIFMSEMPS